MLGHDERLAVSWIVGFATVLAVVLVATPLLEPHEDDAADNTTKAIPQQAADRGGIHETSGSIDKGGPSDTYPLHAIVDYPFLPGSEAGANPAWYVHSFDPGKEDAWRAKIEKESRGTQTVIIVDEMPVVVPSDENARKASNLDIGVSLDLKNATAWEALKAVLQRINCERRFGNATRIFAEFHHGYPVAFFESSCITLALQEVPAREAVAAIAKRSPVEFSLLCGNVAIGADHHTYFSLFFYKDGQELNWRYHNEAVDYAKMDHSWWIKERDEATLPAEECLPTPDEEAAGQ